MFASETIFEKESDLKKSHGQGPPPIIEDRPWGPDDNGSNGEARGPIDNAILAMLLFIGADIMLFAGLIGAFIVYRFGAEDWPPAGQPLLPIGVTAINTGILLASGVTMIKTWRLLTNWNREKILRGLVLTTALGMTFLLVQGFEWVRLIGFGLTIDSGIFGSIFYTLIGCHAVHVAGAVIWLVVVAMRFKLRPLTYRADQHVGIKLIGMYWILVVALWPLLYGLVYLG
ncbi:heme-copper oxidase subunit III [bacterium]|nr:heme-copper oxidase subunit III [bacterium]